MKEQTEKLFNLFFNEVKATLEQVQECLKAGADPNATTQGQFTVLMVACMTKQSAEVVSAIIEVGADIHATNDSGFTPLFGACQPIDEITKQLVSQVLRIETTNVLLEAGANINHQSGDGPDPDDPYNFSKLTPLHIATGPDSVEVVKFMLENGADPNIADALKRTPIFGAVHTGDIELVQALIDGGADVNLTCIHAYNPETGKATATPFDYSNGEEGHTFEIYPLDLAVMQEEHDIATLLLGIGAKYTEGLTQLEINLVHESFADDSGLSEPVDSEEFSSSEWKKKQHKIDANKLWLKLKEEVASTELFGTMRDTKAGELFRPTVKGFSLCSFCISQHAILELRIKHGDNGEGTKVFERLENQKFALENLIKENCKESIRVELVFEQSENTRHRHKIKLLTPNQQLIWDKHVHTSKDPVPPTELWDEIVQAIDLLFSPFEKTMMVSLNDTLCDLSSRPDCPTSEVESKAVSEDCQMEFSFNQPPETIAEYNAEFVDNAIQNGVDTNEICSGYPDSQRVIHVFARFTTDAATISMLNFSRADMNSRDDENRTPLMLASYNTFFVAICLLNNFADATLSDDNGWQAMHWFAANCDYPEIVERLLDAGAEINHINNRGMTPLATCLFSGVSPDILSALVDQGACITAEMYANIDQWVALAESNGRNSEVAQRFVQHLINGEIGKIELQEM